MAYKGRDPVRSKFVTDYDIIEKVNSFNYLGNLISYKNNWTLTTNWVTTWKKQALLTTCLYHRKL